jgi:hypothetical protein
LRGFFSGLVRTIDCFLFVVTNGANDSLAFLVYGSVAEQARAEAFARTKLASVSLIASSQR